ncbi:MAG: hypothetical protein WD598_00980 [Acidimicrobiia bacterium]
MTEFPVILQEAANRRRREQPMTRQIQLQSKRIRRGDLRIVLPLEIGNSEPRLVLVLSVDSEREFADILFVHTASELACEVDGIVSPESSAAPYDIVVQTDLRGVVWTWQLGRAIGSLSNQMLDELDRATRVGATEVGTYSPESTVPVGPRLAGMTDPRWSFKETEGALLREITKDCTEALLDDGPSWVVNPGLLRPELFDRADDKSALIGDLVHWTRTRSLTVSAVDLEHLRELGALQSEEWSTFDDLAGDVWTALHGLVERAATAATPAKSEAPKGLRVVTAAHLDLAAFVSDPESVHYLGRKDAVAA